MATTIQFDHEVQGLARPLTVTCEYEAPDPGCGQSGGFWLVSAEAWALIETPLGLRAVKLLELGREHFSYLFGSEQLRAVEERASDTYTAQFEERYERA